MSCCPSPPSINVGSSPDEDGIGQDTEMRRGESVECYLRRAGTDGHEDAGTSSVPNKIKNNDIPLTFKAEVNVTFELTKTSTRTATSWKLYENDKEVTSLGAVTFTGSVLKGTFAAPYLNQQVKIKVSAFDATGEIDQRGFVFSPAIATGSDSIKFVHPLPGAICNSPYGHREKPAANASGGNIPHLGVDFVYRPQRIGDVVAAADGQVTWAKYSSSAGNNIKIVHPNAAGKKLCETHYFHLDRFYVQEGENVRAGQKIGRQGSTGHSTGPHLHFECLLPNSKTPIDPLPYITGSYKIADSVDGASSATSSTTVQGDKAVLTPANVAAKEAGCPPFGPKYPGANQSLIEPPPTTDIFEKAWFFTMKHEVGPNWSASSPADPDVAAGLIATHDQQVKCGWKVWPPEGGGETKFGVAQKYNPDDKVREIDYARARKIGYNNYWLRGPSSFAEGGRPKLAVMLFDLTYLHGPSGAEKIKNAANIGGLSDDAALEALAAAQKNKLETAIKNSPSQHQLNTINGQLARNEEILAYARKIT